MTSPDGAGIPAGATGSPVGAWGDDASFEATTDALVEGFPNFIGFFIALALKALGDLVGGIPFVGDGLEDILDGIADHLIGTRQTATTAQSSADVAYANAGAAYTAAQNAQTTANSVSATATAAQNAAAAAQTAASNAASVAAAAQETADIAYANAQQWDKEFQVSSAGVFLGVNEIPAPGVLLATPDDGIARTRKITRVIYSLGVNTGTMTVELKRRTLAGAVSTVLTTSISSAATTFADNSIDFTTADLDHYWCNVTAIGGTASVLNCALYGVLLET